MSGKVISLNDETPATTKIRRDQHKKIKDIVTVNSQFPIVALGLVRDYVKNCSAAQVVRAVTLSADGEFIRVHTIGSGQSQADVLGTEYHFRITPESRLTAPTL